VDFDDDGPLPHKNENPEDFHVGVLIHGAKPLANLVPTKKSLRCLVFIGVRFVASSQAPVPTLPLKGYFD
jgi:hypothetical protein